MAVSSCAACGAVGLRPHLRVAGELGSEGLIPTTSQFGTALADISRCPSCGHMQLEPMPDASLLEHAYTDAASEAYLREEAGQRVTARRALEQIEAHRSDCGSVVDLGCWTGFLLAEAGDRGWRTLGVEPSEFASTYARDRLGLEVLTGDLFSVPLPRSSFDAVTLGDVIEHLIAPGKALDEIRELLTFNGILWMALPDSGSFLARRMGRRWWSVLPTHVQYFTRASISTLLDRHGFEVLQISTAPKAFTIGYYLSRIAGYSPTAERLLSRAAGRLSIADCIWAPDFHDRMAVVARPRAC